MNHGTSSPAAQGEERTPDVAEPDRRRTNPTVVCQLTHAHPRNPYFSLFAEPLREAGWDFIFSTDLEFIEVLCRSKVKDGVILHLHQLEPLYRGRTMLRTAGRAARLVRFLWRMRRLRATIVHTMHNRQPHDRKALALDTLLTRFVGRISSRVIVLGDAARDHAGEIAEPQRVRVVRHPNYVGVYGPPVESPQARLRLGIREDLFVALSFGDLEPYKQHGLLVSAFAQADVKGSLLCLVGEANQPEYRAWLQCEVARIGPETVRLVDTAVPDASVADWLGAVDVALFGFDEILMSGSAMLAMSYGAAPIVPNAGCLPEYITDGDNGFIYEKGNVDSLAAALRRAHRDRLSAEVVISSVGGLSARQLVGELAGVYQEALRDRPGR